MILNVSVCHFILGILGSVIQGLACIWVWLLSRSGEDILDILLLLDGPWRAVSYLALFFHT